MKKRLAGIAMAAALAAVLCGCHHANSGKEPVTQEFYAMDTVMQITAYGSNAQNAVNESVSYINDLEADISRTKETSDIYALNHAEGGTVKLSAQAADVLQSALDLAQETDGCFDPTTAPLSDLWGIGTDHAAVPQQEDIDAVLPLVDYTSVSLHDTEAAVPAGAEVDLGGIGKGYATDHVVDILKQYDVDQAIVSLGGNVYALGEKEDGTTWTVGITDPDNPSDYFATLSVSDTAVVTSGDYERYFESDGKRYCHIFDPQTGYPAETDIRSVTVVSQDSTRADAYSTALFVMGYEEAMHFCEENDIQAIFVCRDHTVHVTDGLKDSFVLNNTEYAYDG
ncbi:MAG: FAD:protein FMN transferase [Eubacteriales bacterium]|nr:FAD:protein FMN transferase [Eubacteriales bacterium]